MKEKKLDKPKEIPKEPLKLIEAPKEIVLTPPTGKYTDEIMEGVDEISIEELDQPGGWKKLIIAMYKEKSYENRKLQDKINALNTTNSDLSGKSGVFQERLRQVSGTGAVFTVIIAIAGVMLGYVAYLPDSNTKTILFILGIVIFMMGAVYHLWNALIKGKP